MDVKGLHVFSFLLLAPRDGCDVSLLGGNQEEAQDDHHGVGPAGKWTAVHRRRLSVGITDEPQHWTHRTSSLYYASLRYYGNIATPSPGR